MERWLAERGRHPSIRIPSLHGAVEPSLPFEETVPRWDNDTDPWDGVQEARRDARGRILSPIVRDPDIDVP